MGPRARSRDDPLVRLLQAVARGEETAFAEFYDTTRRRVFGLTLRILQDPKAAEEAAQEAYCTMWRRAGDYDTERGAPMTWVLTVARSKAIDLLRARRRRLEREPPGLEPAHSRADAAPGPEAEAASLERSARVNAALATLPQVQRVAIEIVYFSGLSHAEVAATLDEPVGTVKSRIRRGLEALRRRLPEEL